MLELARLEAIGIYQGVDAQGVPRGPIHLRRRGDAGGSLLAASASRS